MLAKIKSAFFKEFAVTEKCPVKKFVEKQGLEFVRGKVFYQLTKKENVQTYKEVLVKKKATGECIVGEDVKALLDINDGKVKLDINEYPDFDIFIQSSSYNRVLHPDTLMLYQVKDFEIDEKKPVAKATKRPSKTDEETKSTKKPCLIEDKPTNITKANGGGSRDVEVVFSFDTTGSMYACLAEVRRGLKEAIVRLKKDVPGIRIAIIAHGDYCDARSSYVTKIMNFSTDVEALLKFVQEVGSTGGGDADECYELVLKEARTKLGWTKGSTRSLVMIGDCNPHGPNYPLNVQKIDWRTECGLLKEEGVRIYAVQALNRKEATKFYRELATRTDGFHLFLDQFSSIVNFMMAICFKEEGGHTLDEYETEVVSGGKKMNRELHRLFATLQGREPKNDDSTGSGTVRGDGLVPVDPARFQVLHVQRKCSIKDFITENSLIFKTGRGFYEFTKPETISNKKEVVLVDKKTGDMFSGQEAFDMIGAGGSGKVKPAALEEWRVFVQSTSYNRVLVADTGFLYEVDSER